MNMLITSIIRSDLFFKFPILSTHWAQMLGLLAIEPFHDTVDVETVCTCSPN